MRLVRVIALAALFPPAAAGAQTTTADGVHAFLLGDYRAAAAILKPLAEQTSPPDPIAQFFLASLYDSGRGVDRNPMRACGLYVSAAAADMPLKQQAMEIAQTILEPAVSPAVRDRFCAPATTHPWSEALPASFQLGVGHSARLDAVSTTILFEGVEHRSGASRSGPDIVYLPIQYTPLDVTQPLAARRHFIQTFVWHRNAPTDLLTWSLAWFLEEVVGAGISTAAIDGQLITVTAAGAPPAIDTSRAVTLRVNANGEAEWVVADPAGERGGVIPWKPRP
jgi:hypothetical protein